MAYLGSIGQLDAVITEDIDALLFRAPVVLAKERRLVLFLPFPATTEMLKPCFRKGEKRLAADSYKVFRMDKIQEKHQLDSSGLILVALLSGGDYDQVRCPDILFKPFQLFRLTRFTVYTAGHKRPRRPESIHPRPSQAGGQRSLWRDPHQCLQTTTPSRLYRPFPAFLSKRARGDAP